MERGALVLLDGLDEVPDAKQRRLQVKAAVEGFVSGYPRCRFLVTSRIYAYQRQAWKLRGFTDATLAPFTPEQIMSFVDRWYAHIGVVRHWNAAHAQGQAVLLKTAIERSERLTELAARPLLLTLMASLHAWRGGSLPEKREQLYAEAVDLLLDQWEGHKVVRDAEGHPLVQQRSLAEWLRVDRADVRAELERLAFEAHRDQADLEGTADIEQGALVGALLAVARNPEVHANPLELEDYLCNRAGLLVARGDDIYAFPHRTFQEYLAACYLTDHGFPRSVAELVRDDVQRWREVVLLTGAKAAGGSLSSAWTLAEALCPRRVTETSDTENASWGALLAAQVLVGNLGSCLKGVDEWDAPKLERVRLWLRAIVERGWLPPVDRAAAGNALATLGDDRDFDALVEVPEGAFWMGSDDSSYGDEKPRHEVRLAAFRIGKYPVTVGQFRAFVDQSGVKPGTPRCLRGVANHPVVWVSWHEARAYCAWLTQAWRTAGGIAEDEEVRLPTEAEWEKAARGTDGRTYPWGDDWDAMKCNAGESGIGATTPVGMYPGGGSHYGALEMAGNVWQWTSSLWGKDWQKPQFRYPYVVGDEREGLEAGGEVFRVLRGSAFYGNHGDARCAYRFRFYWDNRDDNYGFRVVVSPSPGLPSPGLSAL